MASDEPLQTPTPPHDKAMVLRRRAESALAADLDRGAAGDRYQVVVHVDADVLRDDAGKGQSALEDGMYVPAGIAPDEAWSR